MYKAAAILVLAAVGVVFALGEIEEDPVARRLIRLDARAADLEGEQAADGQRAVADQLGVEPVPVLVRQPAVGRIALARSPRTRPTTGGKLPS